MYIRRASRQGMISLTVIVLLFSACRQTAPSKSVTPSNSTTICTPNDGDTKVIASDIIVAGWIEGWQGTNIEPTNRLETIHPRMDVRQTLKGENIRDPLTFTDNGSMIYGLPLQWGGTGSSCAAFDFDPTGYYAILGLAKGDDGQYYSNGSSVFFIGKAPEGYKYRQALNELGTLMPTAQP